MRPTRMHGLGLVVLAGVITACPPVTRGPSGPEPEVLIRVPTPTEADLREFHGRNREELLAALEDISAGRAGAAKETLRDLEIRIRDSSVLRAAQALADLQDGAISRPMQTLEREAGRATHLRFVQLAYAEAAEMASNFDAALGAVTAALDIDVQRGVGEAQLQQLRRRADRLRRTAVEAHLKKGLDRAEEGELAGALLELERGLELDEEHSQLMRELGRLHLQAGNAAIAADFLQRVREKDGLDRELGAMLGEALMKGGRYEEAEDLFEEVLARDPSDRKARAALEEARAEVRRLSLPQRFRDLEHLPWLRRADLAALLVESLPELEERPVVVRGVVITDVSGNWAKEYVLIVVSRGVMDVYDDHTFGTEERVSRADLASALTRAVRALESYPGELAPEESYPIGVIDDLPRGHGRYGAIVEALNYGLLGLDEERRFRPADPATGAEAVAAVTRLERLVQSSRSGSGGW